MTKEKITLTTDEARKRVDEYVARKYNGFPIAEYLIKEEIDWLLKHFYGI